MELDARQPDSSYGTRSLGDLGERKFGERYWLD